MSWVTVIWSMIATVCVTLAGIYLLVWRKNRAAWAGNPIIFHDGVGRGGLRVLRVVDDAGGDA